MTSLDTLIIIKLQFNATNTYLQSHTTLRPLNSRPIYIYIYKSKDTVCFRKKTETHYTYETKSQKVVQTNEWIENYIKTGDEECKHEYLQKSEEAKEEECFRLPVEFQSDKVA